MLCFGRRKNLEIFKPPLPNVPSRKTTPPGHTRLLCQLPVVSYTCLQKCMVYGVLLYDHSPVLLHPEKIGAVVQHFLGGPRSYFTYLRLLQGKLKRKVQVLFLRSSSPRDYQISSLNGFLMGSRFSVCFRICWKQATF